MGAPQKKDSILLQFWLFKYEKANRKNEEMKLFNNAIFKNFQNKKYFVIRKFT